MAIRTLVAKLVADTGGFSRGMKQAEAALGSLRNKVLAFGGGLLTGAAFAKAINDSVALGDSLAKTADRLGITTNELASLRHAADLAGVSTEMMDKALTDMLRRLGGATQDANETRKALAGLGLDAGKLAGQSAFKSFIQIAEAIEGLGNQALKANAAFEIFGKSGAQLLNVLAGRRGAIEQAAREAEQLGVSIDRLDAAKMEQLSDQFARVKQFLSGIKFAIAAETAPVIDRLIQGFLDLGTESGRVFDFVRLGFQSMADLAIRAAAVVRDVFIAAWDGVRAGLAGVISAITAGIARMAEVIGQFAMMVNVAFGNSSSVTVHLAKIGNFVNDLRGFSQAVEETGLASAEAAKTAIDNLFNASSADDWLDGWETVLHRFERITRSLVGSIRAIEPPDVSEGKTRAGKAFNPGEFREISISRTFIGGLQNSSTPTTVNDPQLKTTNAILNRIFNSTPKNAGAVFQ